jgi:hypothetical protein
MKGKLLKVKENAFPKTFFNIFCPPPPTSKIIVHYRMYILYIYVQYWDPALY